MRQALTLGQLLVDDLVGTVVRDDRDRVEALLLVEADTSGLLGDRGHALGHAGLEELLDTRQTTGDVVADTALVERTHGQLRTGLTDRLGGDDADGLTDVHQLSGGHRPPVAGRTHAGTGGAGQDRADLDLLHAGCDERLDGRVAQVGARGDDDRAGGDPARPRRVRANVEVPTCSSRSSRRSGCLGIHDRTGDVVSTPLLVPQSVSRTMTSWRRRPDDG